MREHLGRLIDHLEWADARAIASLATAEPAPADAIRFMAHIVAAEHVWLARLEGTPARVAVWPDLGVDACTELARENVRGLRRLVHAWSDAQLAEEVAYTNSAGAAFRSRREDILLHVVLHGTYHRGQVALLVRRAGQEPMPTDYIAFVRGAPAATSVTATAALHRSSSESAPR